MNKHRQAAYFKEVRKRIRKTWRPDDSRAARKISFGEDVRRSIIRFRKKEKTLPFDIELWLAFYDEAIAFWLAIWAFYHERFDAEGIPASKISSCLVTLAGRVLQDMVCVRDLVDSGFFVQSNVVTRSMIEAIDVMHLLNLEPALADEFFKVEDNDAATKFWHDYCSRGKIHKRIKERWLWFFDGDQNLADTFHNTRENYLDLVGMSAHPSFAASFASFMDSPKGAAPTSIFYGALGRPSHMSKFTMHLIFLRVFEYGILWSGPKISLYKGEGSKSESKMFENISKGLSVMLSIVVSLGDDKDEGRDPFFPEFQTYWPRPNFETK